MQYSILGKSDLKVSRIGFGCMSLSGNAKANEQLIQQALESGINFFDTADLYDKGDNEKIIGELLRPQRDQVVIATKAGNQWRTDGSGWDWNPSGKHIMAAAEESLRRLKTDYIDLYQLHGGTMEDPIDETIEAFERLKQQGKIRFYGISSIRPNVIRQYVEKSAISTVMMQYSLLDRRPEETCFDLLAEHHISVLGRGGLAQGLLVDKAAKHYLNWSAEEVEAAAAAIQQLKGSRTAAQTALQFVLQQQQVASAVIGIRTLKQLKDVSASLDVPALTTEEMDLLSSVMASQYYSEHR
jgi:aryl-alcohol dehydrogenase-like predicted oxidoreductase